MSFLTIVIVVAVLAAFLLGFRLMSITGLPIRSPEPPAPKTTPACALPSVSIPRQQGTLNLTGISGGTYHADEIVVTGVNSLTSDLVLLAKDRLVVSGSLSRGIAGFGPAGHSVAITLACSEGPVEIQAGAKVGGGTRAAEASTVAGAPIVMAHAGWNGGSLLIIGVSVTIEGNVAGHDAGPGGGALSGPGRIRGGPPAGSSVAIGGCSGYGGDVVICATELISVGAAAEIRGGTAARGGWAEAQGNHEGDVYARGGDGSRGGDITFNGHGGTCQVTIAGNVIAAWGPQTPVGLRKDGAQAIARRDPNAPPPARNGGTALAVAGDGSPGAVVTFVDCKVNNTGTIRSGDGGSGGDGEARGGNSPGARWPGGEATARGGNGGAPGAQPQFDDWNDQPQTGTLGLAGSGGEATAIGGSAGVAGLDAASTATGGSNGDGQAATPGRGLPGIPAHSPGVP